MQRNNKGFTLIEVMVATAILAIIAVAITQIMTTTMKTYSSVDDSLSLQFNSQVTLAQLEKMIINTNFGIVVEEIDGEKVIYLLSTEVNNNMRAFFTDIIRFDSSNQTLYYGVEEGRGYWNLTTNGGVDKTLAKDIMTEGIVDIQLKNIDPQIGSPVESGVVTLTVTFESDGKVYSEVKTIYLPNEPQFNSKLSEIKLY